jgi:predicted nucleic acid-binding protein
MEASATNDLSTEPPAVSCGSCDVPGMESAGDPATDTKQGDPVQLAMNDTECIRASCHQGGPGSTPPPPILSDAPPIPFPAAKEQAPATTTTTTDENNSRDVLLDTNAVFRFNAAQSRIGEGERPVVTAPTGIEEIERIAAERGFAGGLPPGVGVIPDDNSAVLRGQMMDSLRQFGASPVGMEGDATLGATALARGIPLITGDVALFNAFTKLGGEGRLLK